MKKLILWLTVCMLCAASAFADTIQVDLSSATDEELRQAVEMIQAEQAARYRESLAAQQIDENPDGITFRGIPWYSTLEAAEDIIGRESSYRYAEELRRLSYTDYSSISTGADRVDGELGCNISYSDMSVAGYLPSSTKICYIFPIVDGQIIREFDAAQIYMGYYEFKDDDYGKLANVYSDLAVKLEKLYGKGKEASDKYFTNLTWKDQKGNAIRLQIDDDASYMTLAYVAATADQRLDEMAEAYTREKALAEDAIRQENVNNTDGL